MLNIHIIDVSEVVRILGQRENKGRKEYMKSRVRAVRRFMFVNRSLRTFNMSQKNAFLIHQVVLSQSVTS